MFKRRLYTLVFGVLLAVAATHLLSSDAQAMGSGCVCPAGECQCCCKKDVSEELPAGLQLSGTAASETCTCSTGPNPFSTDESAVTVYVAPLKKRFFQILVSAVSMLGSTPTGLPLERYKPPATSSQRLYLLKSSFLV